MEVLSLHGFTNNTTPDNILHCRHETSSNIDTDWLNLRTPYLSDTIDRKITHVFKDEGFPVRIVKKLTSPRQR